MRFLLDAQLPVRLARSLRGAGHDVLHTSDLPRGNRSTDDEVCAVADEQERVVVTKDRDFRDSHLLRRTPRRVLIVATGNMSNSALLALFDQHGDAVVAALQEADFVELGAEVLVTHRRR